MGEKIASWFESIKKPRPQVAAFAVMLNWHPVAGFGAHDPLSDRHLLHDPTTSIIHDFPTPSKLAADYFPVISGRNPQLPRELASGFMFTQSITREDSKRVEKYELQVVGKKDSFVVKRSMDANSGIVELSATYGALSRSHISHVAPERVQLYLFTLRREQPKAFAV